MSSSTIRTAKASFGSQILSVARRAYGMLATSRVWMGSPHRRGSEFYWIMKAAFGWEQRMKVCIVLGARRLRSIGPGNNGKLITSTPYCRIMSATYGLAPTRDSAAFATGDSGAFTVQALGQRPLCHAF